MWPQVIKICEQWLPLKTNLRSASVPCVGFKLLPSEFYSKYVFEIDTKFAFSNCIFVLSLILLCHFPKNVPGKKFTRSLILSCFLFIDQRQAQREKDPSKNKNEQSNWDRNCLIWFSFVLFIFLYWPIVVLNHQPMQKASAINYYWMYVLL